MIKPTFIPAEKLAELPILQREHQKAVAEDGIAGDSVLLSLYACHVCGHYTWLGTQRCAPRDGVRLVPYEPERGRSYPKCQEVYDRAPELVTWVLNVVGRAGHTFTLPGEPEA